MKAMETITYWYTECQSKTEIGLPDLELLPSGFERQKTILTLRLQGVGWTEIGRRFNVPRKGWAQARAKTGLWLVAREKLLRTLDVDLDMPVNLALVRIRDVFGGKTAGTLERVGKERVGDVFGKTDAELLRYRDLGKKSLREIRDLLRRYGK